MPGRQQDIGRGAIRGHKRQPGILEIGRVPAFIGAANVIQIRPRRIAAEIRQERNEAARRTGRRGCRDVVGGGVVAESRALNGLPLSRIWSPFFGNVFALLSEPGASTYKFLPVLS